MKRFYKYVNHGRRLCHCTRGENEPVVRNGLAYSPADMARLTERGMPVNSLNTQAVYFDGEENPSFHVTSDRSRHVDICDLWEEHVQIREKARQAYKASKQKSKTD